MRVLLVLYACLLFSSCNSFQKSFVKTIEKAPAFKDSFTGFVLFDPATAKTLIDYHGDKYFTPASNTKLFTFYAAQRILGDSIPAFRYRLVGDSLWLWGTGDPSLLHPDLPQSQVPDFLRGKKITLVADRNPQPVYGPGWAWDDYDGNYQREKSSIPIYGNALHITRLENSPQLQVLPNYFRERINVADTTAGPLRVRDQNLFFIYSTDDTLNIPFITSLPLTADLLGEALNTSVNWQGFIPASGTEIFYSIPTDSVLLPMLQESDNFLAEQLLLLCSFQWSGEATHTRIIERITDSLLQDLPQKPLWVDGSGLSRYNLFTPQTMVALLHKLYREVPTERLFALLPAGGSSGTIKNLYTAPTPYIFAKTGTLRNNHTLSGYLITQSGKILLFSFMHNHFVNGNQPIKDEMERLLWQIHQHY